MKKILIVILLGVVTFSIPKNAYLQESGGMLGSGAAQYILGSQDELLMNINIWGFVKKPGQYMVPRDTDLISLMSFAGGPSEDAKIKSIKIIRKNAENGGEVLKVDVKAFLDGGDPSLIPQLKPGDTVIVTYTKFYTFKKIMDVVWKIAAMAQIVVLVDYYARRDR